MGIFGSCVQTVSTKGFGVSEWERMAVGKALVETKVFCTTLHQKLAANYATTALMVRRWKPVILEAFNKEEWICQIFIKKER